MKRYFFLSYLFIIIDQLTKLFILAFIKEPFHISGSFFSLTTQINTGIAFSIPFYSGFILPLLLVITIAGCIVAYFFLDWNNKYHSIFFSLIFAGAIGNLIDRLAHGGVIDFIKIWIWPVFNFADIFITIGIIIMFVWGWRKKKEF